MLVPSPVPPCAETLTERQRCELGRYFERHAENDACYRDPLLLALVVAGDKPAAEISATEFAFPEHPWTPHRGLIALCELFELSYRRIGQGTGNDWFIAPTDGRLDLLPSSEKADRNRAWHRRLGVVLGYPPEAIDFFIDTDGTERTRPRDLLKRGVFSPEELAYTRFVFYIHDDSINGYERAIETGRAVRARFTELAEMWHLPALAAIADDVFEEAKHTVTSSQ
ncbi:hypothetical protein [Halocatena salina]|uniref:Uncharacterized protein n=1 Tax=Halocatena salina TaxID=2934340 RepID=A0A8T9ZZU7_9EURY|nr:hypothetical protein [Halocatena salina]UPM42304.1 hypothetical protein MW046_10080 [Halocatena salina]